MKLVDDHRGEGRSVSEVLGSVGVARSSYYRRKMGVGLEKVQRRSSYQLTAQEQRLIDALFNLYGSNSPQLAAR